MAQVLEKPTSGKKAESAPASPAKDDSGWDGIFRSDTIEDARKRNPHLDRYLKKLAAEGKKMPEWYPTLSRDLKALERPNIMYPVGDPIFIHVVHEGGLFARYRAIEPPLEGVVKEAYDLVRKRAFVLSNGPDPPETTEQYTEALTRLIEEATVVTANPRRGGVPFIARYLPMKDKPIQVTLEEKKVIDYFLKRDIVGQDRMEPLMKDPYIEDIHGLGIRNVHCVHKIFDMLETNINFVTHEKIDAFISDMGDRMGRPVSDSNPIVDGALPDGSRINIIYSNEISRGGSSFTIRKFAEVPIPVTQLVAWNTYSPQVAAYLWLCLENGMSVFVSGETASGKTTTLNGILPFIKPQSKILTAEDTPEVNPPHENWQQLVTRETGPEEARVSMYALLKAALRSRPDYVIVGEIRGAEGAVAFQAMQTGHATMATFHASSVGKLIQRFTSAPISVPAQFMDNLNVVLIQMAVYVGGKMLRRVLAVEEIEGYSKQTGGVETRAVFTWNPVNDTFVFSGRNNSFVLEQSVAERMQLEDKRDIYKELDKRAKILEKMIELKLFDYFEVQRILFEYANKGEKALPFKVDW
ncbi:MAG: type II/IV secretion system ATPase subunit [Euryarchaeota archaeon]|nr:type II/IV secretion system ATPase subunit [Euryarchaeota archaeon]